MRRAVALFVVFFCVLLASAHALQITDERGVTSTFTQAPQRIVSLLPSLTESVCAMGQCQRLVGVDRYSNFPVTVQRLPSVGGGLDPNIEGIVALRPDVVLLATSSRAASRLESLGLKVVALEPKSHDDMRRVLQALCVLLGQPDTPGGESAAMRLWREIDAGVQTAAQSLSPGARNTRVYFEVGRGPYAAGESSFIGQTLLRLGVKNIVPAALGPFPRLNPEFVVRANPDLIMITGRSPASFSYPGWAGLRAIREQRICSFNEKEGDVLVRPGPRMAEAARLMARCLESKTR
jgi:iron complex transport system substrate-binding protein